MARLARVVAVGVPHHITQRGNGRQFILTSDAERTVYMELLRQAVQLHSLSLLGYCLMSNHVHLVAIPEKPDSLANALKETHGRYATYWNAAHGKSGHAWQGRFYSCPLDEVHLWEALRYTELNPVRAGMVEEPQTWKWSSTGAHCGTAEPDPCLTMERWKQAWTPLRWQEFLAVGETEEQLQALRQCTHSGRPLGSTAFIETLEQSTQRKLAPRKGGRPARPAPNQRQGSIAFDE